MRFRYVFVAESPHVSEVEPAEPFERRPLCGAAGKVWWKTLSEVIEGAPNDDLSLERFLGFCRKNRIAVMNAVQFPLDPKILKHISSSEVDPMKTVGFSKEPGPHHYKKAKDPERSRVLGSLRERLLDPSLEGARVVALGNDADWFIGKALEESERTERQECRIAHPSAWWRRGGYYGEEARKTLKRLFS